MVNSHGLNIQKDDKMNEIQQLESEIYTDIPQKLRTHLTVIRGFTEILLSSQNLDPVQQKDLQTILKNELCLEKLVEDIENKIMSFQKLKL